MMKRLIKSFILLLIPISLAGQLEPVTSQYVLNPLSINPSYAGNRGALSIAAFYRKQWTGISGAPETLTFTADAPFIDSKLGLGLTIASDKIGVTKETHIMTNYSYKLNMSKGELSLGLGAGLITTNTAWSDLVVIDPEDVSMLSDSRVFVVPEFSFGAYYSHENFFAGLSIPKLLSYNFSFEKNKYTFNFAPGQYNYLLNTGYVFSINPSIKFLPSTLISYSPGEKVLFDINAYAGLNDKVWAGVSYRNNRSFGALIQFAINNQLRVAYTYDFDFGDLGSYSNGSHEIMLRYEFRYKVEAISPLNF
jgi:type IX secretion system PorP/SprF family membrane protein